MTSYSSKTVQRNRKPGEPGLLLFRRANARRLLLVEVAGEELIDYRHVKREGDLGQLIGSELLHVLGVGAVLQDAVGRLGGVEDEILVLAGGVRMRTGISPTVMVMPPSSFVSRLAAAEDAHRC